MTENELSKSAALTAIDISRQLRQVILAKGLLSVEEATLVISRSHKQTAEGGRDNIAQVIALYFGPELKVLGSSAMACFAPTLRVQLSVKPVGTRSDRFCFKATDTTQQRPLCFSVRYGLLRL